MATAERKGESESRERLRKRGARLYVQSKRTRDNPRPCSFLVRSVSACSRRVIRGSVKSFRLFTVIHFQFQYNDAAEDDSGANVSALRQMLIELQERNQSLQEERAVLQSHVESYRSEVQSLKAQKGELQVVPSHSLVAAEDMSPTSLQAPDASVTTLPIVQQSALPVNEGETAAPVENGWNDDLLDLPEIEGLDDMEEQPAVPAAT